MYKIYLDDIRTPEDKSWIVVRSYEEFTEKISEIGLKNIEIISLDHDLDESAMREYFRNVVTNFNIDYDNIYEKTGYDCAKWLINHCINNKLNVPIIYVHSANPVGTANIIGYINNYLAHTGQNQTCIKLQIPYKA
jgi:5-formaminoimidazole-4-carboxamide-1-beta-D-ribofuranosyl 5'-monophosphate synthetase